MAYKKWDLVWVYWIHANKIKELISFIKENEKRLKSKINIISHKNNNLVFDLLNMVNKDFEKNKDFFIHKISSSISENSQENIYLIYYLLNILNDIPKINIIKAINKEYRPCLIFHKSNEDYWVMPLSTTNETNFNENFDVAINEKSHVECCSIQKINIDLIKSKMNINEKTKLDNLNLQNKIIEKFTWFFLK